MKKILCMLLVLMLCAVACAEEADFALFKGIWFGERDGVRSILVMDGTGFYLEANTALEPMTGGTLQCVDEYGDGTLYRYDLIDSNGEFVDGFYQDNAVQIHFGNGDGGEYYCFAAAEYIRVINTTVDRGGYDEQVLLAYFDAPTGYSIGIDPFTFCLRNADPATGYAMIDPIDPENEAPIYMEIMNSTITGMDCESFLKENMGDIAPGMYENAAGYTVKSAYADMGEYCVYRLIIEELDLQIYISATEDSMNEYGADLEAMIDTITATATAIEG